MEGNQACLPSDARLGSGEEVAEEVDPRQQFVDIARLEQLLVGPLRVHVKSQKLGEEG